MHAATLGNLGNAYGRLGDRAKQRDLLERAARLTGKGRSCFEELLLRGFV